MSANPLSYPSQGVGLVVWDNASSAWKTVTDTYPLPVDSGAGVANPTVIGGVDGAGLVQPLACNQDLILLPSAARTVSTNTADQVNRNGRGLWVWLNVTVAVAGTGGLTIQIQGKDPASGQYKTIFQATAAVVAVGTSSYEMYPGAGTSSAATQVSQAALPATWRVLITVGDASSYTYSVGASVIL